MFRYRLFILIIRNLHIANIYSGNYSKMFSLSVKSGSMQHGSIKENMSFQLIMWPACIVQTYVKLSYTYMSTYRMKYGCKHVLIKLSWFMKICTRRRYIGGNIVDRFVQSFDYISHGLFISTCPINIGILWLTSLFALHNTTCS